MQRMTRLLIGAGIEKGEVVGQLPAPAILFGEMPTGN
jgi:hypothetical protein